MKSPLLFAPLALALAACAALPDDADPQRQFWARLQALCGQAYEGRVVSTDAADRDMAGARLVNHVASGTPDTFRFPCLEGEDRSRTWVLYRTAPGLRRRRSPLPRI